MSYETPFKEALSGKEPVLQVKVENVLEGDKTGACFSG
jgi:hypothetical protein